MLFVLITGTMAAQADIYLDPIVATACGPGLRGTWPRCFPAISNDDDLGPQMVEDPDASDPVEYPNPEPPCETGNPHLDSAKVEEGMKNLWGKSNSNDNLFARKEQAGWIVRTATGYRIHDWNFNAEYRGNCGDSFDVSTTYPPEGMGAIVGFVHTHPYDVGENILDCNGNIVTYDGTPSDADRTSSYDLGRILGRSGPLKGYILDKNGIRTFEGANTLDSISRCGY
jgi:hypothetical protein